MILLIKETMVFFLLFVPFLLSTLILLLTLFITLLIIIYIVTPKIIYIIGKYFLRFCAKYQSIVSCSPLETEVKVIPVAGILFFLNL